MAFTPVPAGYYRTAHWRGPDGRGGRRWQALASHNFTCQACGRHWGPERHFMLEVHHTPEAYGQLGREDVWDLIPLCGRRAPRRCHPKGCYSKWEIHRDRASYRWLSAIEWLCFLPFRWLGRLAGAVFRWLRTRKAGTGRPARTAGRRVREDQAGVLR